MAIDGSDDTPVPVESWFYEKSPLFLSGNVLAEGEHGEVTALLRQFPEGDHFVVFRDASIRAQASTFFATLLGDETPLVPAP